MNIRNSSRALLNLKSFVLLILICQSTILLGQQDPIGSFDHHHDVGDPKMKGSAVYNKEDQTYLLSGAGANVWAKADQFHFVWKKIKGDFIIKATIQFIGKGTVDHRKIGIMARDKLTTDSRYADACVHGDDLTSLQYRTADGDSTKQVAVSVFHPTEIELERAGNTFTFSAATRCVKTVTIFIKEFPLSKSLKTSISPLVKPSLCIPVSILI